MGREFEKVNISNQLATQRHNIRSIGIASSISVIIASVFFGYGLSPGILAFFCVVIPSIALMLVAAAQSKYNWIERERNKESERRGGKPVLGLPPDRTAMKEKMEACRSKGKLMVDNYLVGFSLESGEPLWVSDDDLCTHAAVFAKTGVGKTLWLQSLMFQQMARGRASGFTFIDAKRDMGTLADIIMMALMTGRIEDLVVIDPFDPVCSYNFVFTTQRADVKARKVLRCGLPPTSDQSATKHYDRLAADAVYRVVRAMESFGLAWSVRDIAVALSAFQFAYPRLRSLLHEQGSKQAMIELGHLAGTYRGQKGGTFDAARITENLRGIASELHSIAHSEAGEMFCVPRADLSLTDAILRGKLIYYMLPRLEEAESAARMVKVFREDLEVSIGEITSNRNYRLEDPHMVIVDEGASTFGPTWANLFELARKGRFALLFGAQSVGGLVDDQMGLSEQFYERVLANVNLKVIMRVGDNRTATDMSEWIGKVNVEKKTLTTGLSTGVSARELTKHVEFNKRASDNIRDAVAIAEDEKDLVSPDELKHEMSAEKGLAWFDLGDGNPVKGRSFWFNADLPASWEGREYLVRYEAIEADEIGLAEWVDEYILTTERAESERDRDKAGGKLPSPADAVAFEAGGGKKPKGGGAANNEPAAKDAESKPAPAQEPTPSSGPFRFNMARPAGGKPRARTFVGDVKPEEAAAPEEPKQKESKDSNSQPVSDSNQQVDTSKNVEPSKDANAEGQNGKSSAVEGKSTEAKQSPKNGHKKRPKVNGKTGGLRFGGGSKGKNSEQDTQN